MTKQERAERAIEGLERILNEGFEVTVRRVPGGGGYPTFKVSCDNENDTSHSFHDLGITLINFYEAMRYELDCIDANKEGYNID